MMWSEWKLRAKPSRSNAAWLVCVAGSVESPERMAISAKLDMHIADAAEIETGCSIHPEAELGAVILGAACKIGRAKLADGVRISEGAIVEDGVSIGKESFVLGSHVRVQQGVSIGERCLIEETSLQPFCSIGNDCVLISTFVGTRTEISDSVHTAANTTIEGFCRVGQGARLKTDSWAKEKQVIAPGAIVESAPVPMVRKGKSE